MSKGEWGRQIGFVDGNENTCISAWGDEPVEAWLVSWLTVDGGAILLRERSVTEIPAGVEQEYF